MAFARFAFVGACLASLTSVSLAKNTLDHAVLPDGTELRPSATSQPSLETRDIGTKLHVTFTSSESPIQGKYDAFVGPRTRLFVQDDGSLFVESGWVYVERASMAQTSRPTDEGPMHEEWVATSRVTAGAEGSKLLIWVEGNAPDDIHRVVYLEGRDASSKAYVTMHRAKSRWISTNDYMTITLQDQYPLTKTKGQDAAADDHIRYFLKVARQAFPSVPNW